VSKLTVNTGSSANFGDGTPLRTAFGYINSNFNELYANALISNNMTVGNSTVNATVNSTSFSGIAVLLANSTANTVANLSGFYTTGTVNALSITVGTNFIANGAGVYTTGVVNAVSYNIGTTVTVNSTGLYTGSATDLTTGSGATIANDTIIFIGNNTTNAFLTTVGLNINAATIANTSGVYTTTVNAASHTVGTSFIANSTGIYSTGLTNASAFTTTGATNTGTFNAVTSANVAGVVLANSSGIYSTGIVQGANLNITGSGTITGNLSISGNLTISGNSVVIGANNLVVLDSVISLHTQANLAPWTSSDGKIIGTAYHYYLGGDKQALLSVNQTNAMLTYYDTSTDAAVGDPTGTTLGTIQANTFYAGNSTVYATVNATNYSGTSYNANNLGTVAAASYALLASPTFTGTPLAPTAAADTNTTQLATTAYVIGQGYQKNSTLSANVATLTANNANNLGGQLPAYYTNATNMTSGTLPDARLTTAVVNTSGIFTITGVHTHNANLVLGNFSGIVLQGSAGANGYVITSNGTYAFWTNLGALSTNVDSTYAWTNTHSWSNVVTFNNKIIMNSTLAANGTTNTGTAGFVLYSGGASGNVYWAAATPATNVEAQFAWTNTQSFSNTITFTGAILASTVNASSANIVTTNSNTIVMGYATITSNTLTAATNAAQTLDTYATATYRSSKYDITLNANGQFYETSTVNIVHDGTNIYISEYGIASSNGSPLATYTAAIATGTLTLTVTPVLGNTVFKFVKTMVNA
jgi:hypothetical protein